MITLIKGLESTLKIKFQNSIHPRHFNNRKEGPVLLKTFPASFLTQDGYDSRTLESTLGKVKNDNFYHIYKILNSKPIFS